jgi:3D (Asp-Asp-Asp) domain-containing protein
LTKKLACDTLLDFPKTGEFYFTAMMKHFRHIRKHEVELVLLLALAFQVVFPQFSPDAQAAEAAPTFRSAFSTPTLQNQVVSLAGLFKTEEVLPEPELTVVNSYRNIPITAYSSTVDQTDNTPCITANGYDLCDADEENVIAANFLKFGTKIRMPELYGERIFTVQDRMNARYYYRADIWMKTRKSAQTFGIKYTTIEVVTEVEN